MYALILIPKGHYIEYLPLAEAESYHILCLHSMIFGRRYEYLQILTEYFFGPRADMSLLFMFKYCARVRDTMCM